MSGSQTVILGEMPALSKLYVNAAAAAARRRVLGTHGGTELPAYTHEVRGVKADVANLTAFQHLIGESASDVLPAGFIHALAFPLAMSVMNRDDFPLPLLGMIHLTNTVVQSAPVLFTQALDIRARVDNLRGHRAGTQARAWRNRYGERAHGGGKVRAIVGVGREASLRIKHLGNFLDVSGVQLLTVGRCPARSAVRAAAG